MESNIELIEKAREHFADISLEAVEIDKELKQIEVEKGRMKLEVFKAEKIEKVIYSSIEIFDIPVTEESVIIWPGDNYNYPVFWCNLTKMPGMNMAIIDYVPLMDLTIWPEYAAQYLTDFQQIKKDVKESLKDQIVEEIHEMSSVVICALSPYRMFLNLSDEGVSKFFAEVKYFCNNYIDILDKSAQKKGEERDFGKRKKEAVRKLMKENDPGYPIMISTFGEELTGKVFDIIF